MPDHIDVPKSKRHKAPDEIEELQEYRPVEPEFGMAGGDRALVEGAAAGAEPHHADVAGIRRISKNTRAAAPNKVGTTSSIR